MKASQKTKVLDWLQSGKSLTPLEALDMFGSMRLAAIIEVLRNKEGYNIINENKTGEENYAKYRLATQGICKPVLETLNKKIAKHVETIKLSKYANRYTLEHECVDCPTQYRHFEVGKVCKRC